MNTLLNSQRQLRNGWWIVIFLLVHASLMVPTLIAAQQYNVNVSMGLQAVLIGVTSFACQMPRRKPLAELVGKLDLRWFKELSVGSLIGSALMLIPALTLGIVGWIVHYMIGIAFAITFVAVVGAGWLQSPTVLPASLFGWSLSWRHS